MKKIVFIRKFASECEVFAILDTGHNLYQKVLRITTYFLCPLLLFSPLLQEVMEGLT